MNYFLTLYCCAEFQISLEKALISHLSIPFLNLAENLSIEKNKWKIEFPFELCFSTFVMQSSLQITLKISPHLPHKIPHTSSQWTTLPQFTDGNFLIYQAKEVLVSKILKDFSFCGWCYQNDRHFYFPDIELQYAIICVYSKSMSSPNPSSTPWRLSCIPLFYLRITE